MAFALKIQGTDFTHFQDFKLNLAFNSIASSFSFNAEVDPEDAETRKLFKPFSYRKVEVFADDVLVLTGVILNHEFVDDNEPNLIAVDGYSVTGVLQDSSIPLSTYPLQSDGKTIAEIARALIAPFGLSLSVQTDAANAVLETSTAEPTDSVSQYLDKLCAQKNIVLTHSATGQVVMKKVRPGRSTARLTSGSYTSIGLKCNGQAMHDKLTALRQASSEDPGEAENSLQNPFIVNYSTSVTPGNRFIPNVRPRVKEQTSDSEDGTKLLAQNMQANELRNIAFEIDFSSWYLNDQPIAPEQVLTIVSQEALFLDSPIDVFVESVTFKGTSEEQTASVKCVLPEVYNGQTPRNFFI